MRLPQLPDVDLATLHQAWRMFFGAFLALALGVGLYLSFQPTEFDDPPPEVASADDEEEPAEPEPVDDEPADIEPDGEAEEEEAEDELTQEEADALIAAARDPEETSVQVLDAGGGSTATGDVADALAELGYDVVAVNSSRTDYSVTTVLYTAGNEAEADALNARDQRFAATAENERLSEDVDLHVVVGPDWQ